MIPRWTTTAPTMGLGLGPRPFAARRSARAIYSRSARRRSHRFVRLGLRTARLATGRFLAGAGFAAFFGFAFTTRLAADGAAFDFWIFPPLPASAPPVPPLIAQCRPDRANSSRSPIPADGRTRRNWGRPMLAANAQLDVGLVFRPPVIAVRMREPTPSGPARQTGRFRECWRSCRSR